MKKTPLVISMILVASFCLPSVTAERRNAKQNVYVPNGQTAIKIAEAIWLPIFGESIYKEKPFKAILIKDRIWYVHGTLHTAIGGTVNIEIQKSDCKILSVSHGK